MIVLGMSGYVDFGGGGAWLPTLSVDSFMDISA